MSFQLQRRARAATVVGTIVIGGFLVGFASVRLLEQRDVALGGQPASAANTLLRQASLVDEADRVAFFLKLAWDPARACSGVQPCPFSTEPADNWRAALLRCEKVDSFEDAAAAGGLREVQTLYDSLAAELDLELLDWGDVLAPGGTFTWEVPGPDGEPVRVRIDDGVHLTPAGSDLVARSTVEHVQRG